MATGHIEGHWLATVGIAVAESFVLDPVNNSARYRVYGRLANLLSRLGD